MKHYRAEGGTPTAAKAIKVGRDRSQAEHWRIECGAEFWTFGGKKWRKNGYRYF